MSLTNIRRNPWMKKPCANCPFRKVGAISLRAGRVEGIIRDLTEDDKSTFHCHKTVHSHVGGDWDDDGNYHPSGLESFCPGAAIYLLKIKQPNVAMRISAAFGLIDYPALLAQADDIIDPPEETP